MTMMRQKCSRLFLCLLCLFAALSSLPLSGCDRVTGSKTDPTPGTYRLVEGQLTRSEDGREITEDLLAEGKGTEAYVVITAGDFGFYVYRDKDASLSCRQVRLKRQYESAGDVAPCRITVTDDVRLSKTMEVQSRRKTLTVNETDGKTTRTETYRRVSKATDLSFVSAEMDTLLTYVGWDYYRFDGAYDLFCVRNGKRSDEGYIYRHVVIDTASRTATVYEAATSDRTPVSYTLPVLLVTEAKEDGASDGMTPKECLKIGDELFYVTSADYLYRIRDDAEGRVVEELESFRCLRHTCDDKYRAELIEAYRSSVGGGA